MVTKVVVVVFPRKKNTNDDQTKSKSKETINTHDKEGKEDDNTREGYRRH